MTQAAMNFHHHDIDDRRLSNADRDRVIARIAVLRCNPVTSRFYRVASRLQYWLAGVESGAQWLALYDCLEQDYIRWRVNAEEAIDRLRWLGISASIETDLPFGLNAEMARRANAARMKAKFDSVRWELDFNRRKAANDDDAGWDVITNKETIRASDDDDADYPWGDDLDCFCGK